MASRQPGSGSAGRGTGGTGGPRRGYEGRPVYVISVAADLAGVHPQTLRIYERKGLLSPERTAGNTRRYSDRDVEQLRQIQRLTQEGVNLAGVRMILDMQRRLEEVQSQLERTRRRLAQATEGSDALPGSGRPGRPHWGVLARLDDVRNIYSNPIYEPGYKGGYDAGYDPDRAGTGR